MICADDPPFALRHQRVRFARTHGLKVAARHYGSSRNTVRKWCRRAHAQGHAGLHHQRRAPKTCPHQTKATLARCLVARRKQSPGCGARRRIAEFDLPLGHNAAQRILKGHHLTRPPKSRRRRKNDLRAVKAAYVPGTRFQMDVKYLTDLPFYWPQMQRNGRPRFQYTIRELSCGAQFQA
jgi:transposase